MNRKNPHSSPMKRDPKPLAATSKLRSRAEKKLREQAAAPAAAVEKVNSAAEARRLLHELQVHQVELEMQNAELRHARDELEAALDSYTDLYDFAPVGYFTLSREGIIRQVNLTGSCMVGVERSRLVGRSFRLLAAASSRAGFDRFLQQVFASQSKQSGDFDLPGKDQDLRTVNIEAQCQLNGQACRIALVDVTERIRAEVEQRELEALSCSNAKLKQEILHREKVEKSLLKTKKEQSRLLEQSRGQQEKLRDLSRQILNAQEEERKRISRELHDIIAQALVGINVHVAALRKGGSGDAAKFQREVDATQALVEKSVEIVHQFSRELRPTVLDDLGLIPALQSLMKNYMEDTGVRASLKVFAGIEECGGLIRTALYRVVQESLANVARHAKASQVEVSIQCVKDVICMEIRDNGQGFEVPDELFGKRGHRLGLLGMRERIEMVGGTFEVDSSPARSTTIRVKIPLAKKRRTKE